MSHMQKKIKTVTARGYSQMVEHLQQQKGLNSTSGTKTPKLLADKLGVVRPALNHRA